MILLILASLRDTLREITKIKLLTIVRERLLILTLVSYYYLINLLLSRLESINLISMTSQHHISYIHLLIRN
jgi:hypothetical protein